MQIPEKFSQVHHRRLHHFSVSCDTVQQLECWWFMALVCVVSQIKSSKCEAEIQALTLKSLLYLERYMYLILFNTYLHLEKRDSWQRSFSDWMLQVRSDVHHVHLLQC